MAYKPFHRSSFIWRNLARFTGECSRCTQLGGYCLFPSWVPTPYCYDAPYPQCVIDSNAVLGGAMTPLLTRNASDCGAIMVGVVNVAFVDYGNTNNYSARLVSQGFLQDLFVSPIWDAPATYTLSPHCATGAFPPTLGSVARVVVPVAANGLTLDSSGVDAVFASAFNSNPSLVVRNCMRMMLVHLLAHCVLCSQSLGLASTIYVLMMGSDVTVNFTAGLPGGSLSCVQWCGESCPGPLLKLPIAPSLISPAIGTAFTMLLYFSKVDIHMHLSLT